MAMAWRKSPPELIELFESVVPGPPAERRKMFGYPSAFVNGQLFIGLHQENLILRLSESDRGVFLQQEGAALFEPMPGRPMREYVAVPPRLLADGPALRGWVAKAYGYSRSLPPKAPKAPKAKRAAPAKAAPAPKAQMATAKAQPAKAKRAAAVKPGKAKRAAAVKPAKTKRATGRLLSPAKGAPGKQGTGTRAAPGTAPPARARKGQRAVRARTGRKPAKSR